MISSHLNLCNGIQYTWLLILYYCKMVFTLCGALKQNCSKNFSNSSINYWLINVNYYSIKILQYNLLRCYGTPLYYDLLLKKKKNKSKYKDIYFFIYLSQICYLTLWHQWVRVLSTNLEVMSLIPAGAFIYCTFPKKLNTYFLVIYCKILKF